LALALALALALLCFGFALDFAVGQHEREQMP